ncbi:MAG: immune inhibitor A [Chloroflexota bacterium]|nr:immune inhibitor A [Chloroflexota bacterium]
MKRKILNVLSIVVLLMGMLVFTAPVAADGPPSEFPRNSMAPDGLDPMDLSVEMLGEDEIAIRKLAAQVGPAVATNASPVGEPAEVGDEFTFTVSDDGLGIDYDEDFVVVMEGEHGLILITKDAFDSFDGTYYHFENPIGDDSEPWLRSEDLLTPEQLAYMLDQFDTVIWPTNTTIYGEPLARGEEGQKIWTLIFNIRDDAYYNPDATSYVAGYFSASESAENNKNIMHIDTYDWANRTGPDANRPYLYEGVFAHEFEHLIHFDQDPDEPSWVDEGMADLAGFFCGYGHSSGHIAYYMVYHPMVSLTFWGSALEDYGASYLFQLYLYEQFGGAEFITALVQEQANGIEGIENTLAAFGYSESFDEIFDAWTVANYLDDTEKAGGKYGYETLEVGTIDTWGYSIEYALSNMWWGPPDETPFGVPSYWFFDIEPQPYTAHYFRFNNDKAADVFIDGDDFSGTLAYSGNYEWYSDAEAWAWRSFYQSFDIPAGGATLDFYTFYEIEDDWDYGYVEVYDHDTGEWYTLDAPGTVDYVAHGQDNPNTPDGREPTDYEAAGRWHGFTGYSGGWVPVSMDLSPFAGHTIDLYFTTWQDGAFTLQMMYVDDISIPEIGFFDDVEAGEDGWASTGWYVTDGIQDNGFGVVTIDTKWVPTARYPEPAGNNAMTLHSVSTLTVDPVTQAGVDHVSATPLSSGRVKVSIVANHADHILSSHYDFWVQ